MFEEDENEDFWYFDSVRRYEILSMFELKENPYLLTLIDIQSIGLVSLCKNGNSELVEFKLPTENAEKTRDLKFKCGKLFQNKITQIKALYGKRKILSSEETINGISVYDLPEKSGSIEKIAQVNGPLISPRLAIKSAESPHVFIAKMSNQDGLLIDIDAGSALQSVTLSSSEMRDLRSEVTPLFVDRDLVALCCMSSGVIDLHDLRTNKLCCHISNENSDDGTWTFDSKYNAKALIAKNQNHSSSELSLLSRNGYIMSFDSRNWKQPVMERNLNLKTYERNHQHLIYNPNVEGVISLTGFDNNVYVYRTTSDSFEHLFTHDGHSHVENCDRNSIVVSHAWTDSDNVVSSAENKTFHLWRYSNYKS